MIALRDIDNIKRDTNPEIFESATDKKPTTLLKGFLYFYLFFIYFFVFDGIYSGGPRSG